MKKRYKIMIAAAIILVAGTKVVSFAQSISKNGVLPNYKKVEIIEEGDESKVKITNSSFFNSTSQILEGELAEDYIAKHSKSSDLYFTCSGQTLAGAFNLMVIKSGINDVTDADD